MGNLTRRAFLKGSALGLTALGGVQLGFRVGAARREWQDERFLVFVFLRGGMDGLNLVPPISGADREAYEQKRPTIRIPISGPTAALPLSGAFGLHFAAGGLHELYQAGRLAIVHGVGFPQNRISRSHFEAQDYIDLGTPGELHTGNGWLARHLLAAGQVPPGAAIPSLSAGASAPLSLLGRRDAMTLDDPSSFHPNANSGIRVDGQPIYKLSTMITLHQLYAGSGTLDLAGSGAARTVDLVDALDIASYTPSPGANYPTSGPGASLGNQARLIANVAKRGLGLQVATLDYGGWDTHQNQGSGDQPNLNQNAYAARVDGLSQALSALYADLAGSGMAQRMVVIVQSEFGRRVRENANRGTDHGSGNPMLVLGGRVNGGRLHGTFGGLQPGQLYQNEDVATTTDSRRVHAEVISAHLGNPGIDQVFPGYAWPGPMGVIQGDSIFSDGFD
ncbi:DUF1501 domain-containing protein [Dokdonella sp.]|uniref:DUF1501 domain-containing protein n=1 Tax=Dokdonella sp. TaxID=2291710 RepID=UPI0031CAD4EE|nr:DUF1501 domain-containing protein [Dokdonella sp.]